jgi:peptidoglycan/LPS O-acetylase OafA/YrhL
MSKQQNRTYMPQLDGLRAFAVVLVIISHWFSKDHFLNRFTDNGALGVTLFFVLSGYLITAILLRNKESIERGSSLKNALKTFYIRRSLRIFPIYYLLIILLLIFNVAAIQKSFSWHFFYLSNFYLWHIGQFPGSLSHFWSLAVEEQFYMFWPALIFLVPRSKLVVAFAGFILFATVFRVMFYSPPNHMGRFLMPASLDSFCIGGLLAYGQQYGTSWYKKLDQNFSSVILATTVIFIAYIVVDYKLNSPAKDYLLLGAYFLIISVLFGLIIMRCSKGINNKFVGSFLNNRFIIYLGKISYGLYLFHNFIPYFYNIPLPKFLSPASLYIVQIIRLVALIGLSSLSWLFIEKPILRLKERFSYKAKTVPSEPLSNPLAAAPALATE